MAGRLGDWNSPRVVAIRNKLDWWLQIDPDPATKKELTDLMDKENHVELENLLFGRMAFGTAGLRARMAAGFTRMNVVTIIQTTQGLASYLIWNFADARDRGVVIGCDARHNSESFLNYTALVFAARGIPVHRWERTVHTPLVPFAVCQLGAVAGVMITASHNPRQYNGYKVYGENGCQINSPIDEKISDAIDKGLNSSIDLSWNDNKFKGKIHPISDVVQQRYIMRIAELCQLRGQLPPFVYTPLHGVGFKHFVRVMKQMSGQPSKIWEEGDRIPFIVVPEQQHPHPDFPTVKFPNPEEKGALDLAKKLADERKVDFILANDPDADRLCVAEKIYPLFQNSPDREDITPYWHQYSGNQLGVLLAAYILENMTGDGPFGRYAMLRSDVSIDMIDQMINTKYRYCRLFETPTGFKWLGNRGRELQKAGFRPLFAYEEALGYMLPQIVWDKDGISAAALFLTAVAQWKTQLKTPWQKLEELYKEYGIFGEADTYLISPSQEMTKRIFDDIRNIEKPYPSQIKGLRIERWRDRTLGYDSDPEFRFPPDPSVQMITAWCDNSKLRFTARSSGTEPKIKIYVEVVRKDLTQGHPQHLARDCRDSIIWNWFNPTRYNLQLAPEW